MNLLATIIDGEVDIADFCWLVAVILFVVAAVIAVVERGIVIALIAAGLAFTAFAFLAL